jgi:hypothetical protein
MYRSAGQWNTSKSATMGSSCDVWRDEPPTWAIMSENALLGRVTHKSSRLFSCIDIAPRPIQAHTVACSFGFVCLSRRLLSSSSYMTFATPYLPTYPNDSCSIHTLVSHSALSSLSCPRLEQTGPQHTSSSTFPYDSLTL